MTDDDDLDDLGRSDEVIDLDAVSARAAGHENSSQKKKQPEPKKERDPMDSSSDEEGQVQSIQLNIATRQGVREALEFQMRIFDYSYDFDLDELCGGES